MVKSIELTKTELENLQDELSSFKRELDNLEEDIIKRRFSNIKGKKNEMEQKTCPKDLEPLKKGIMDLYDDIYRECQNKQIDVENTTSNGLLSSTLEMSTLNAPSNTGTNAPSNTGTNAPSNTGANAPSNTGTDVPSNTGANAPSNTGTNAPSTTGLEAPGKDNWLERQRKLMFDKDEWKNNTKDNILRVLSGCGIVGGGCYLITRLFSKKKEKDSGSKEKKGFWETGFGKFIMGVGVATGLYYLIHGLTTGKRRPSEALDFNSDERTETPEEQVSDYEALTEQQREVYEKIGGNINEFYGNIREQERKLGFEDENYLGTISEQVKAKNGQDIKTYKGLVPFCIDMSEDNIQNILSEHSIRSLAFNSDKEKIWGEVKNWGKDKLVKVLGKFVPFLDSFKLIQGNTLGDKLQNWLQDGQAETQQRKTELEYFFRQYAKVLAYVNDKKTALEYELAKKILLTETYDGKHVVLSAGEERRNNKLILEALDDDDWVKEHIEKNDKWKKFMNSRLFYINKELKDYGLDNGEMSKYLKEEIVEKYDREAQNILDVDGDELAEYDETNANATPVKTIIDKGIEEKESGNLERRTKNKLENVCDDLKKDIEDEFSTGIMYEYFQWIAAISDNKDYNIAEFLEQTGLAGAVESYQNGIQALKDKIENGNITKDDLQSLKSISEKWFAFKKEIEIAIYTMRDVKSDNPDFVGRVVEAGWVLIKETFNAWCEIFKGNYTLKNFATGIGGLLTIYVVTHPISSGKYIIEIAIEGGRKLVTGTIQGGCYLIGRGATTPRLSAWGLSRRVKNITGVGQQKSYFLHYITSGGTRNEKRLVQTARDITGNRTLQNMGDVLNALDNNGIKLNGRTGADVWECCQRKNLAKLAVEEQGVANLKWTERLHPRQNRSFIVNAKNVDNITETMKEIQNLPTAESQKIMRNLLYSVTTDNGLEVCHDLTYGAAHDFHENFIKSLGKIRTDYLKGVTPVVPGSRGTWEVYKEVCINKFGRGNQDKIKMVEEILSDQSRMAAGTTQLEKEGIKAYETVKHTISKLNKEEINVLKQIFSNNPNGIEAKVMLELLSNGALDDIIRDIKQLSRNDKTRSKIGEIIARQAKARNLSRLENFGNGLKALRAGREIKFISTLDKLAKTGVKVLRMLP